jgi:sigma-54 specific flagellar transcriptional regulator A
MGDLTVGIVSDDAALEARIRLCLEFMGETVVQAEPDILVVGCQSDGSRPHIQRADLPLIYVGQDPVGDAAVSAQWLSEPLRLERMQAALHEGYAWYRRRREDSATSAELFPSVIGVSESMARVRSLMGKVCTNDSTVLITGESGTGKEVVARAVHDASGRRSGPFVPVNCGAIPAELLESELFGYEKGAFTGAVTDKAGRFELAAGGTLFLDEIGDMPLPMQVKVLRAIQDRSFERVGGIQTRHADVRIIAATHQDLEAMILAGRFREDLYYRLNVFPIVLPPLRERAEDIPGLINAMSAQILREQGLQARLTQDALRALGSYLWPGNVRELKNLLERLAIEFPNELVAVNDLPMKIRGAAEPDEDRSMSATEIVAQPGPSARLPVNGVDLKDYLARLERTLIEQALEDTDSIVARAADRLHIRRTTLVEKMRKYGIERGSAS